MPILLTSCLERKHDKVRGMDEAGWVVDVTLYIMGMQSKRLKSSFLVDPVGKLILKKQVRWSLVAPPAWGTLRALNLSRSLTEALMLLRFLGACEVLCTQMHRRLYKMIITTFC